ncbi:hypothetical protein [Nonomuraea typhae]|uniref:hypothetical protein n=1 Tax=Nonomuraea typhae TaxID=2603600 RepID=UPI0012F77192|nr:hypothetical protein [Nonomuraea typhae]
MSKEQPAESVRAQVTHRYVSRTLPIMVGLVSFIGYAGLIGITTAFTPDTPAGRVVLVVLGTLLTAWLWVHARTRPRKIRLHLAGTAAAVSGACLAHELLPFAAIWQWSALLWLTLAISWVLRILVEESARDPQAGGPKAIAAADDPLQAVFALAARETQADPMTVRTTKAGLHKISGVLRLDPGEDAEQFLQNGGLATVESGANLPPGALNGAPSRTSRRELHIDLSDPTALDTPPRWPGPSRPGASIADPAHLGLFQTLDVCEVVIIDGNVALTGTTGAGKGFGGAWGWLGEAITRTDAAVFASDPAKDSQTLGVLAPALHVVEYTAQGGIALLNGINAEIPRRTKWLAERGYASWRQGCGLKYWIVWLEEFPKLVLEMSDEDWDAFKSTLKEIRSAGGRVFVSLQDLHHSEVDDIGVVKGQFGRMTFGMMTAAAAGRSLTDRQNSAELAPGSSPEDWKADFPGRALIDVNGLAAELATVPLHTWNWGETDAERYATMRAHVAEHTHTKTTPDDEFTARIVAAARARAAAPASDSNGHSHDDPRDERDKGTAADNSQADKALREAGIHPEPGDDDIDPRQPIVSSADPSITFPAPPPAKPKASPEQARRRMLETLCEWAEEGRTEIATADMRPIWEALGYSRPWAQKVAGRLYEDGLLRREGGVWILLPDRLVSERDRGLVDA